MKIGFLGGGNMAEAIIAGMLDGGFEPDQIVVFDIDRKRTSYLESKYKIYAPDHDEFFKEIDVIVLAVKPQAVAKVLKENDKRIIKSHLLISIAAGISISYLKSLTSSEKIVRVMPNTPSLIGRGISAICRYGDLKHQEISLVEKVFSSVGEYIWLEESQFNGVTALSGSGPAYLYRFVDALIDSGVLIGLSRDLARKLVVETVIGSIYMIKETGESPKELEAKVTSPGGTTIHGLMAMENGNFSSSVKEGVQAAYKRAIELGTENK